MNSLFRLALSLPRNALIGLVRVYQLVISPHFPASCRFVPTCSEYAVEALRRYGVLKGLILSVRRITRCHPWGDSGYDPPRWFGEPQENLQDEHRHVTLETPDPA